MNSMTATNQDLDWLSINTIRTLCIDLIQQANSGHPGLPLGAAPMTHMLWHRHMRVDPENPDWPDRDRFVLSAGHGSSLLYCLLHLSGFELPWEELTRFRQWGSIAPGHPESYLTPGVDATTGPLGQGLTNAMGMAMAERFLANRYNRPCFPLVDHYSYALVGDGCLMEGIAYEAASLAGHLKLGRLICLYDSNEVTLDGSISLSFSEDVKTRFEACGWQVLSIADGDRDLDGIDRALTLAREDTLRPSLIIVSTTIGFGSPGKQGTSAAHGAPLGEEEVAKVKLALGFNPEEFLQVPDKALAHLRAPRRGGPGASKPWQEMFARYRQEWPELARSFELALAHELPPGWDDDLPAFAPGESLATRVAAGETLNVIASRVPWLLGGDADLSCSTKTALRGETDFNGQTGEGRNIHYGVREHAMAAIANGLAYHRGVRNYVSTFFVFCDYMRPAIRMAAMNRLPVVYVFTHDSVAVGEDGPTHQPIEQLMSLRLIPGLTLIRPADPNETAEAWRLAMANTEGPTGLILSRQSLATLDPAQVASPTNLRKGAYVLRNSWDGEPDALLIATGSEVHVALGAQEKLATRGIHTRVVSMPSWELFEQQDQAYRDSVIPPHLEARISVEAGITFGWQRWLGARGIAVGIDRYGASAPGPVVMEKLGITVARVANEVAGLLER